MAKVGTSNSDLTISLRLQCVVRKHNISDKVACVRFESVVGLTIEMFSEMSQCVAR